VIAKTEISFSTSAIYASLIVHCTIVFCSKHCWGLSSVPCSFISRERLSNSGKAFRRGSHAGRLHETISSLFI